MAREKESMRSHRTLVRRRAVGIEEFFTPTIILLGAAAVSVYAKDDGHLDLGTLVSKIQKTESETTSTVVEEVKEEPAPAPAPAPVKAAKKKPAPPPPEPAAPAPAPAPKTTTELVKEVASKIEDQRATEELVASRKAAKEAESSSEAGSSSSEPAEDDFEEILEGADKPKSGKKRKFVLKVIKKVIAPWRKWENIQ
jgi:type IV secretory pathway VirB10-like protein